MIIIITNGYPRSGKTTLQQLVSKHFCVDSRSSIDLIKELYAKYFNWGGKKNDFVRKQLSDLKSLIENETDFIQKDIFNHLEESKAEFFFIDIREPQLIEQYKELLSDKGYTVYTIFVTRPQEKKYSGNKSDDNVSKYIYDFTIENDGTKDELEEKALELLETMKTVNIVATALKKI